MNMSIYNNFVIRIFISWEIKLLICTLKIEKNFTTPTRIFMNYRHINFKCHEMFNLKLFVKSTV